MPNKREKEIKIVDLTQSSGGGGGVTPSQMSEAIGNAVGKGLEVGFDGTLTGNVITFTPPESTGTYDLKEDYDYIVDLSFPAVGTLEDTVEMEIENDGEMIQFFTITHTDVTTSATVADLKDVMKYDTTTGYRWVFRARCHITSSSSIKCFVILPTVQPASSGGDVPIATTSVAGKVMPDGTTITVDTDGKISAIGGTGGVTEEELNSAIETHNTSTSSHEDIRTKIEELELYKTPNAVIKGNPTVNNGQVSDFSEENYLQFPFVLDLTGKSFEIDFSFTTGDAVGAQQNILDSNFGLAIAIGNSRTILAMSSDGKSWDIANAEVGTRILTPNTTYYCKFTRDYDASTYELDLTTDPTSGYDYDIIVGSESDLYPRTMFIGGGTQAALGHSANPFGGIINMNDAKLIVNEQEVWQGMDDVGISTRMATNMANIDADGIEFIQDMIDATLGPIETVVDEILGTSTDSLNTIAIDINGEDA